MRVTIEIPDSHIDNALAEPCSRYWADEALWDTTTHTGYVVERENGDGPKRIRHELDSGRVSRAVQLLVTESPLLLCRLCADGTDGPDGDALLQLMAFGELRYG